MIRFTQLDAGTRSAFETLLREIWQHQTWCAKLAQDVVQWRYVDRSNNSATWLAMEGDTCVATLDSMLGPYLLDGQRILVIAEDGLPAGETDVARVAIRAA